MTDIDYRYGIDGNRISAHEDVTEAATTTSTLTEFLIDARNHTGYQQVLEETSWTLDAAGDKIDATKKVIVYTIGHDQISQSTFVTGGPTEGETLAFD